VNLVSGDPKLAPLASYGGPTSTMPPLTNSPAIDATFRRADTQMTDQRGAPRQSGPRPDIGAVEAFPFSSISLKDSDSGGIGDRLKAIYQLTVGIDDSGKDQDGDESSDSEEIANMTNPVDSSSVLKITSFVQAPNFNPVSNPLPAADWRCIKVVCKSLGISTADWLPASVQYNAQLEIKQRDAAKVA
jgi:hypothetical protein